MPQPTKHLLKRKYSVFVIAIFVTKIIAYLSLARIQGPKLAISHSDKIAHGFAYFVLAFSWLLVVYKIKKYQLKYIVIITCIIYGIIIEFLQSTVTTYRTFDWLDAVANTIGVITAMLIFNVFFKKTR